jgi:hypothetical protein
MYFRHLYRPKGSPRLIRDGHYVPEMPGAAALFVLARRERLDALRPFAFEDTDQDANSRVQNRTGLARRVFLAHYDSPKNSAGQEQAARRVVYDRWPTVPEWLAETARFAKRPDVVGAPGLGRLNPFDDVVHTPGLHPDPVVPIPWNKDQLETFDRLPTLGYVHRPHYIPLTDADGKPSPAAASASRPSSRAGTRPSKPSPTPSARPPSSASSAAPAAAPTPSSSSPPSSTPRPAAAGPSCTSTSRMNGSTSSPASATPARPACSWAWPSA